MHRRLVYICLLNVPSFSSCYFNKIKRTSRLGILLALSPEILATVRCVYQLDISGLKITECAGMQIKTFEFENNDRLSLSKVY